MLDEWGSGLAVHKRMGVRFNFYICFKRKEKANLIRAKNDESSSTALVPHPLLTLLLSHSKGGVYNLHPTTCSIGGEKISGRTVKINP